MTIPMIAYKYRSGRGTKNSEGKNVFERDITLLSKDIIYVPTVKQLINDPAEVLVDDSIFEAQLQLFRELGTGDSIKMVEKSFRNLYKSILSSGIYSLSKKIDNEYYQVELKDDSYQLLLKKLADRYPTSEKYSPNHVNYDMEEVLEADQFIDGVGYKYREFV